MTVAEREELLNIAFRPHYPIEDPDSFFGREMEAARVVQALHSPGQHVVIYGERGAGKTSLARVSTIGHTRIDVFCESESSFSKIARDVVLKCQADVTSKIVYDAATNKVSINGVMRSLDELDGNSLKAILPAKRLVLVFDEVDRLPASTIADLGEFTKNVATDLPQVTLIFVGVGETVGELLRGHESVFRNIRSVGLGKFDQDATIQAILDKGGKTLGLEFSSESVSSIVSASDRYPYYVQLLGITSARLAMTDGAGAVTQQHVTSGAESAAQDADESLRDAYDAAILSSRSDVYRFVLWGLANLDNRVEGSVGQIAEAASRYSSVALSPQVVGAALNKLALDIRGGIVAKRVMGPKKTFYSFNHPLMRGFVRLRVINANQNGA